MSAAEQLTDALKQAALAVSSAQGEGVFDVLVEALARILRVEYAVVSVYVEPDRTHLRTLATRFGDAPGPSFEYPIAGTPCERALGRDFAFFGSGVQASFPADHHLGQLGIEGYSAVTLTDAHGRAIGVLAVMSRSPMKFPGLVEAMLKIFAVRLGSEIERRRSEASYRAIFDAIEDAVFVLDLDSGRVVDVNPKACSAYGYTRDELLRLGAGDLSSGIPPYTGAEAVRRLDEARRGRVMRFEWHVRKRDGSLHWDEVSLKRVEIAGRPYVLATGRDISARKADEERLSASESQYRAIFHASVDALVLRDADFRIVDVNPAYEQISGLRREDVVGREALTLTRDADRTPEWRRAVHVQALAGEPVQFEARAVRADGTRFDLEIRAVPIVHRGRPHVLYVGRDITERREAEERRLALERQLRQAQKMEAIGQLAGGVAHDFNNILQSILGNLVLASERQEALGDERLGKYLERSQRSVERARDLIRQMLTFSRGQRAERRTRALPGLVREAMGLLGSSLPSSIELRTRLDEGMPPASLDPLQIEQVLLNLCINARDAMRASGTIELGARAVRHSRAECASCRQAVAGRFVELSVSDTGGGIAPRVLERMFEPFFSTKETGKGSGMGLAMAHGIVHEHGGHILVDTEPGKGSTFRLLCPAIEAAAPHAESGALDAARVERRLLAGRVLVAEDEDMIRELLAELLSSWGLEVAVAADGAEARDAFASEPDAYDLVITDQTMPRLTGLQLARTVTRVRPGVPVVLCTGYAEVLAQGEIEAAGVRTVARKPITPDDLRALVEAQLARKRGGGRRRTDQG